MRGLTLLILVLAGTCVYAQDLKLTPLEWMPNQQGTLFYFSKSHQLVTYDTKTDSLIFLNEGLKRIRGVKLFLPEKQRAVGLYFTPAGHVILECAQRKNRFLDWFDAHTGECLLVTPLERKEELVDVVMMGGDSLTLLYNREGSAYLKHLRLSRDTMAEPVNVIEGEEIQLVNLPLRAHCPSPGNRQALVFQNDNTAYFALINGQGQLTEQTVLRNLKIGSVNRMVYHPGEKKYFLGGQNNSGNSNELRFEWYNHDKRSLPSRVVTKSSKGNGRDLMGLLVLNDDRVLVHGYFQDYYSESGYFWADLLAGPDYRLKNTLETLKENWLVEQHAQLSKGRVLLAGVDRDESTAALVAGVTTFSTPSTAPDSTFSFGPSQFYDQRRDSILDAGESAHLSIPWEAHNEVRGVLSAEVRVLRQREMVLTEEEVFPGTLLGKDSGQLRVPLRATLGLSTGITVLRLRLKHEGKVIEERIDTLSTRSLPAPIIAFSGRATLLNDDSIRRGGDTLEVSVRVTNLGRSTARDVLLYTPFLPHVYTIPNTLEYRIDSIQPNQIVTRRFKFLVYSYYEPEELPLNFFLEHPQSGSFAFTDLRRRLPDIYELSGKEREPYVAPELDEIRKAMRGGPLVPEAPFVEPEISLVIPKEQDKDGNGFIESPLYHVPFRVRFISPTDIEEKDVFVTDANTQDRVELCFAVWVKDDCNTTEDAKVYELQGSLPVPATRNRRSYDVHFKTSMGTVLNKRIIVRRTEPITRILHVFTMGIPYGDGIATDRAADSIRLAFKRIKPAAGFFKDVKVHPVITDVDQTSADGITTVIGEITKAIARGKNKPIRQQDYLVFYLTGHGKKNQSNFDIITALGEGRINAYNDVIRQLGALGAHKLFLFDVCFSAVNDSILERGAKNGDLQKSFGTHMVAAATSFSYVPGRKLSLFTEELLQTFTNANAHKVGMLTASNIAKEVYQGVRKRFLDKNIKEYGIYTPRYFKSNNPGLALYMKYFYEAKLREPCSLLQE